MVSFMSLKWMVGRACMFVVLVVLLEGGIWCGTYFHGDAIVGLPPFFSVLFFFNLVYLPNITFGFTLKFKI